ncbi:uncharacterized protein LOC110464765 [Mizuhopecten yessoensis]|uniref:uncharacterized protein LOC110464765 n=1 Tax=Mizuhopecten yessoensis TaxID=6573 RepID=UPI000B459CB7|nr:uncharacterized protein LOC110464765 [Mizuhopecten yessoensis]
MKGIVKTNPFTMSGYFNVNNPCKINSDVVYDSVNDQFISFLSGSLWGCRWGDENKEIRSNTISWSYPALDSEDRLLFGYWDNCIVSLRLDDASAEPVVVVNGTTVENELVLDTERNEIYWWTHLNDKDHRINRVSYNGDSEIQVWGSSSPLKMITFQAPRSLRGGAKKVEID